MPKMKNSDLEELQNMLANDPDRDDIERSSKYLGYKLLWAIKLFLNGNKFPRDMFRRSEWHTSKNRANVEPCNESCEWHVLVHDLIDLITHDNFIETLCEIDAGLFF